MKADISIWQLIVSSKEHRDALLEALTKLNVASDTSLEAMVNFVMQDRHKPTPIILSDDDLPDEGA